jgi:uncharacterized protein (DUF58 family)
MSPTSRAAVPLVALAVVSPFVPVWIVVLAALAVGAVVVVDALAVRERPAVSREAPVAMVRGLPAPLRVDVSPGRASRLRVRQPVPPDLRLQPGVGEGRLDASLVPRRRGLHALPQPAVRLVGPLGLGAWTHVAGEAGEVRVYPDVPGARRLATAVQQGRFREEAKRRGPLGLGTEFESIREYAPDDDIRQVNWRATQRLGRPMSNQFRVERDRDVVLMIDSGRLTAAPLGEATRLDLALDAAVAVAAVADVVGDRCGAVAFAGGIRRSLPPRRAGSRAVVQALFDLEPEGVDSDYERAFQEVTGMKRAFVLLLTDLLEETAARPLLDALPVLARRHAVAVASVADPDLDALMTRDPERPVDVYRAAVALDVLAARARVAGRIAHTGATVVEAPPVSLAAACVRAYLRAKRAARL